MTEIPRDRYGRPMLVPAEGGDRVPYTRVSTLAKCLDDQSGLTAWKQRKVAEGLLKRPALMTRLSGIFANGHPDADAAAKREVNRLMAEAMEAAGASTGSSAGTGLHALTEAVDRGEFPEYISAEDHARLTDYVAATTPLTALDAEVFVVIDEIGAAGSFDRLWRMADGRIVIGDLKTGKSEADYPFATTVQIAMYAHGLRYDLETDARSPIHPDLDLSTGLLVHMPPSGGCRVLELDLTKGWRAAQAAHFVHHTARKWRAADLIREAVAS